MKKIVILMIFVSLLQACSDKSNEKEVINKLPALHIDNETSSKDNANSSLQKVPSISITSSTFQSVIGWVSNDEILFILFVKGEWTVQSYSVSKDSWKIVYTSPIPIIQGFIHPNKERILLHTSSNSAVAEVQILHKNGYVLQSLSFESEEIYIDWHPTNPDLLVFSTFYDDWSYNTFVYNNSTQLLQSIDVENPFVKWYDQERLMVLRGGDSNLDGSELMLYSIKEQSLEETAFKNIIDVQNLGESMLYIYINEHEKQYEYRLIDNEGGDSYHWTSPAVSNYSEWVIPSISIVNPKKIIAMEPLEGGNIDEMSKTSIISSFSLNGEQELGEISSQQIVCAPNGKVCLGGYEKENWIRLDPLKEQLWMHLVE